MNFECRISKEGILSIFVDKKRQSAAIPSFEILRLKILRFCGSLFNMLLDNLCYDK